MESISKCLTNKLNVDIQNSYSKELNLLIVACKQYVNPGSEKGFKISTGTIDYILFNKLLRVHSILPIVFNVINSLEPETISNDFKIALKNKYYNNTLTNLNNAKELVRVLKLLYDKGINVIPYKGVVFTDLIYKDIGKRNFSDLDFIVDKKDLLKIKEILLKEGYKVENDFINEKDFNNKIKNECELNFSFFQNEKRIYHLEFHWRFVPKLDQISLDFDDIKTELQDYKLLNFPLKVLNPQARIMAICAHHGAKESWSSIKQVCDISMIIKKYHQEIDWNNLLMKLEKYNIINYFLLGVTLGYYLFQIELPVEVNMLLNKKNKVKRHALMILKSYKQLPLLRQRSITKTIIMKYHMQHTFRNKISLLYHSLIPKVLPNRIDLEVVRLPKILYPLYLIVRVLRLSNIIKPKN